MRFRKEWTRPSRITAVICVACFAGSLLLAARAYAEERKFVVMLAHSPKAFVSGGDPGLPPDGLLYENDVEVDYFNPGNDPNVLSFREFWQEVSYGDVTVTGDVFPWIYLPWAFEPNAPNAPARASPEDFIDLHTTNGNPFCPQLTAPIPFAYGAGENFCDCMTLGDTETGIALDKCGALIILDLKAHLGVGTPPPRGPGMPDFDVVGVNVWTPGERFLDVDGDLRWDGVDEKNDMMCHRKDPEWDCNGNDIWDVCDIDCRGLPGSPCDLPDCGGSEDINGNGIPDECECDCCPCEGEEGCPCEGRNDFPPCGCHVPGCGDLYMPYIDWDQSGDANNCSGPGGDFSACDIMWCGTVFEGACPLAWMTDSDCDCGCQFWDVACPDGGQRCPTPSGCTIPNDFEEPTNCLLPTPEDGCSVALPECCAPGLDSEELDQCIREDGIALCSDYGPPCEEGVAGLVCQNSDNPSLMCCEYHDFDDDGQVDVVEPFEDFMIRWNPHGSSPGSVWVPVSDDYVIANYPGDVNALLARTGNGYYDSPDLFHDAGNTKMMQDPGIYEYAVAITPEPGWYDQAWEDRYGPGSPPPDWPILGLSPRMREFDPDNPVPTEAFSATNRRWFRSNAGGFDAYGRGIAEDPFLRLDLGTDSALGTGFQVLPEEEFGYYDGWVEHDDLPSSKYHHAGDKRLGEVTSPFQDTVTLLDNGVEYPAIFGVDLGTNDPNDAFYGEDGSIVAAGPYGVIGKGVGGYDAGNVLLMEWLTWRTDGDGGPSYGYQWEIDNGPYHPFAGPSGMNLGFRDYNLDGMIDQGEARPTLSENYSVDSDPETINNGHPDHTLYPFNRRRMVEDVVEALDGFVDWDNWIDPNSMRAVTCGSSPAQGFVSGIVLTPPDSYGDPNLFPYSPSFYPIHNEDNADLWYHDLVMRMDGRGPFPSVINYAAHEYGHAWEHFPDMYDYDKLTRPDPGPVINHPIDEWDLMSDGGLVHFVPPLKAGLARADQCTDWIEPIDLTTVLTPGVDTVVTLSPAAFVRDSYYFIENEAISSGSRHERMYFWSAGSGFDSALPGAGMLILHTDLGPNFEADPEQQREEPFTWLIVQADGLHELEAGTVEDVSVGDAGDPWPGTSDNTEFDCWTNPAGQWNALNACTGLEFFNVVEDGGGSVRVTFNWRPMSIPGLKFVQPPGGESLGGRYEIRFRANDLYGGTTIRFYYGHKQCSASGTECASDGDCPADESCVPPVLIDPNEGNFVGLYQRTSGGMNEAYDSIDWNIAGLADGDYYIFAQLIPGPGSDGIEDSVTVPRAGRHNAGNGTLNVETGETPRLETWKVLCVDSNTQEWVVTSSLTQPAPEEGESVPDEYVAHTGEEYSSVGGEITFTINQWTEPFRRDDTFVFSTTGMTAASLPVTIRGGHVQSNPTAGIVATPLSGFPPLTVTLDGRSSFDPQGRPLEYRWDFGDNSAIGTNPVETHEYNETGTFPVTLTVTNPDNLSGEDQVPIHVINNSPNAVVLATPINGPAPLDVAFDGSQSSDQTDEQDDLIFHWDFGDGTTANGALEPGEIFMTVDHTYINDADGVACTSSNPCFFVATLAVYDTQGGSDYDEVEVRVGNSDPVVSITYSALQGPNPWEVIFNAIGSTDLDNDDLTVEWKWDDGSSAETSPVAGPDGVTGAVPHTFALPEGETRFEFHPTAIVSDGMGGEVEWGGVTVIVTEPEVGFSDPVASFTIEPNPPILNEPFTVNAVLSFDRPAGDLIASYSWDFDYSGDHSFGTGVIATHTYSEPGSYTICLTVADAEDPPNTNTKCAPPVVVTGDGPPPPPPENHAPTAVLLVNPLEGFAGITEFNFDARTSSDADGDLLTFTWSFGDGTSGSGNQVTHIFDEPGNYLVRLTVKDPYNASTDATQMIAVSVLSGNQAPVAIIATGPRTGTVPVTLTFDGRTSFDTDGDQLSYTWELKLNGVLVDTASGATITWTFELAGTYTVVLAVSDGQGGFGRSEPEIVEVTARVEAPGTGVGDIDPPAGQDVTPNSANQRPGRFCGFGMLLSMFGTLLGLSATVATRGRFRR